MLGLALFQKPLAAATTWKLGRSRRQRRRWRRKEELEEEYRGAHKLWKKK